jgi:hypothetical protein
LRKISHRLSNQNLSAFTRKPGKLRELALNWALLRFRIGLFRRGNILSPSIHGQLPIAVFNERKIHFWIQSVTPGARIAVLNMLETLREEISSEQLPWKITCGPDLPSRPVDILVSYKAVPPIESLPGRPVNVLLFCDQLECFWDELDAFDYVVVHSSRALAEFVACRHSRTVFIEECEDLVEVKAGGLQLDKSPPSTRSPLLVWHGHRHTLEGLGKLRHMLENFSRQREVRLRLISNHSAGREQWGALAVERVPYEGDTFAAQVAEARLGLVPTRNSRMKHCLFKPSSRLRRLFALGVPALGERRCSMVREFAECLPAPYPTAKSPSEWNKLLCHYWDHPSELDALAIAGHACVRENYAIPRYTRQWIRFLALIETK